MVNAKLLRKIQEKHPEYSLPQIKFIINKHWHVFNLKLCKAQIIDITINKIGTIHTHKNITYIAGEKLLADCRKVRRKKAINSDKNLLF